MSDTVGADPFENEYDPNFVENLYRKRIKEQDDRIEQLEAALRELSTDWPCCEVSKAMREIARTALEGKKDD